MLSAVALLPHLTKENNPMTHEDKDPTPAHGTPRPSSELLAVLQSLRGIADYADTAHRFLRGSEGLTRRHASDTAKGLAVLVSELFDRLLLLTADDSDTPNAFGSALER